MADGKYKLTYFDWTGLAELSRLIFSLADVPFEDVRLPRTEDFPQLPAELKAKLPWEQVPILEVDGVIIAQSAAINRFLARRFNLCGKDEFEAAKCDEIVDAVMDLSKEVSKLMIEFDDEKRAELVKNCMENVKPKYMRQFNKIIEENGGGSMVGDGFTWADVYVCQMIPYVEEMGNLMELQSGYPAVQSLIQKFRENSRIKNWYATRPPTPAFTLDLMKEIMARKMVKK